MKRVYAVKKSGASSGGGDGRGDARVTPSTMPINTPSLNVDSDMTQPQTQENENENENEDHQEDVAHTGKKELHPEHFWFSKPEVVRAVTNSLKAHYNHPYMNWSEVPQVVRNRWFLEFERTFTWKPEFSQAIRREFEKKGRERLKDVVNKAAKVPEHVKIKWMTDTVRGNLMTKRRPGPFKLRSSRATANRMVGQTKKNFDPGHRQGSISTIEVAERLAIKNKGIFPSAADVYEKTHSVQMDDGSNLIITKRAMDTLNEYESKLEEYEEQQINKNPDDVYLEMVGGPKKGKVYGLGSASFMFFKASNSTKSKDTSCGPSMISELSNQVEECKKMAEEGQRLASESLKVAQLAEEKYERGKAEWLKEKEEYHANMLEMKKTISEMQKGNTCVHNPHNPSGVNAPSST